MSQCTCTPSYYCYDENQYEPAHLCEMHQQEQDAMVEEVEEYFEMVTLLEEWSGNRVKPLKPKPVHGTADDLPF
jgi:hypothetical protein